MTNLNENIHRIKSLMSEDKEDSKREMIRSLGLADAIKYFGNYYTIEPYLKVVDKVNFIKEKVAELSNLFGDGITLVEPIDYSENDEEQKQIEYLRKDWVVVEVYDTAMNRHIGNFRVKYESLPVEIIELLVEILVNH
jgi:hypothetical protein